MNDIVFLDTETLGIDLNAPIWELAAVRRRPDGTEANLHLFIHHDPDLWLMDANFPESFKRDYHERYSEDNDVPRYSAARILQSVDPDDYERHTAMGDVRWTMAQYDAVMGKQ